MRTLARYCTIQRVTFHKQGLSRATTMCFQNIDGLYWVFDVASIIDCSYRQHSVDCHGRKEVIIATGCLLSGAAVKVKRGAHLPMILLDILVLAALTKASLPNASIFTLNCSCMNLQASLHASR